MGSLTLSIITVVAIILAPIIAIQVNERLGKRREVRSKRLDIFRTLMALRANQINEAHVIALNRIDVEFYSNDKKSKAVVEQWKLLRSHLHDSSYCNEEQKLEGIKLDQWSEKLKEHELELLMTMAESLDFEFDKSAIKATSYYPIGLIDAQVDNVKIRSGLCKFLDGKVSIPVIAGQEKERSEISEQ